MIWLRPILAAPMPMALAAVLAMTTAACKPKPPSCQPGEVEWGVQMLIEAGAMINVGRDGQALPTVVRLYQVRGELVLDELDFKTVWAAEDTKALGDGFISVEEMTLYPGQRDQRVLPVESEATHIIAAAWFREPMGNTWFTSYEIPRRHPEVVCDRAPETRVYPNPCLYVLLDRSLTSGGATPPSGFTLVAGVQCAPLGVVPGTAKADGKKKKKRKKRKKPGLPQNPGMQDAPQAPGMPQTPSTPQAPSVPQAPTSPQAPSMPSAPSGPAAPTSAPPSPPPRAPL